jgi:rhamnogalacturonan endolyase
MYPSLAATWGVIALSAAVLLPCRPAAAQRQMEHLGRGLVALRSAGGEVFVQWRLVGTDSPDTAFNVYRVTDDGEPVRLYSSPFGGPTHVVDRDADPARQHAWFVRPVIDGRELPPSQRFVMPAGSAACPYLSVPITPPEGYHANDASVGDLDGDGEYEIVVHMVGQGRDNSLAGFTTEPIFDAYRLDGTRLWRINLGKNIREGAHYTPFMVYDLDGDGRAEFACRTADGTQDGKGNFLGERDADHRNPQGSTSRFSTASAERRWPRPIIFRHAATSTRGATATAIARTDFLPASPISTASGRAW